MPWSDAWSTGQLKSKLWLLDELVKIKHEFSCIYVIGGWLGILSWLLLNDTRFCIEHVRSFDVDPLCEPAADRLNINDKMQAWKFKAITADAVKMKYSPEGYFDLVSIKSNGELSKPRTEKPDCIINTSCDHFEQLDMWIDSLPDESLIILQNTNVIHDDTHIGCAETLQDFEKQANLRRLIYSGELNLGEYKRFMLIGKK